jgi:hypothetical protein
MVECPHIRANLTGRRDPGIRKDRGAHSTAYASRAWLVRALRRTAVGSYAGAQTVGPATPYTDEHSRLSLGRGHVPRGLLFTSGRPNAIPPWGEGGR